ncbi:hypothetical protein SKAU_G00364340 [Synaphobranchus kaupii]|uniref:Uncharacterized protein n=1 Tax=Synaphobranchus kaupii TaxID=118154 RepID=A0A9Q1ID72_SYNKA|nr:hypothetical protein SKAU_G00364340 [Synaphobranchus kaupii]
MRDASLGYQTSHIEVPHTFSKKFCNQTRHLHASISQHQVNTTRWIIMPQIPPLFAVEFFWHSRVVRAMASSVGSGSLSFSISFSSAWSQWWQELLAQGQWERLSALLASSFSGTRA